MKIQVIYKICSNSHAIHLLQISEQLWIISNSQIDMSSTRGSLWPRCVGTSEKMHTDTPFCHTEKGTVCCFWDQIYHHMVSRGPGAVELVTSVKFHFKHSPLEIFFFQATPADLMCCIWEDFKGKMIKLYICMTIWCWFPRCCHFSLVVP